MRPLLSLFFRFVVCWGCTINSCAMLVTVHPISGCWVLHKIFPHRVVLWKYIGEFYFYSFQTMWHNCPDATMGRNQQILECLFHIWTVHPISGGCFLHKIFSRRVLGSFNFSSPSSASCRSMKYELVPQKRIKGKLKDERSQEEIWTAAPWILTWILPSDNVSTEFAICKLSNGKCTPWKYSSNLISYQ